MAQLRDARTSALVAEGTPLELVLVAGELDRKAVTVPAGGELPADAELLFDDVGGGFDADHVRAAHEESLENARQLRRNAKGEERERLDAYLERLEAAGVRARELAEAAAAELAR